ncbi:ImmA/IrrE family metallo-endopeptidase [Lentilactobacillus otakiensis]|uniref:ImmA/IrrE family metallo-endopeptidase n=1 Tax=Lentilactobacillus otakiensis TaxID=481720 RepID=UPI003D18458D
MATSVRIPISKKVLQWIIENSDYDSLNDEWKKRVSSWLDDTQPTINQIKIVSNKIHMPFGYFFLNKPPKTDVPLLQFRTVANEKIEKPSRNLIDVIHDMETKQVWLSDYRKNEGFGKNQFVSAHHNTDQSAEQTANLILNYIGLEPRWNLNQGRTNRFTLLREKLDEAGITVMYSGQVGNKTRRTLDQNEFRAFVLIDDYAPLVFINSNDSYKAMLFSLVHEMVHAWFGSPELFNADLSLDEHFREDITEQQINHITEEIIFPKELFTIQWHESEDSGGFSLYNLKASRIDKFFAQAVDRSARSGDITYTEAFELVNVSGNVGYDKLMNKD